MPTSYSSLSYSSYSAYGYGSGDGHGSSCTHTLFELVHYSSSIKVVSCFFGLLMFTIFMELFLERIDEHTSGTAVHEVLQKLYKELMLLGFISFGIFIVLSTYAEELTDDFVASFEYAHFVMFFVGVGLVSQTLWSIAANKRLQKTIWVACGSDYETTMVAYRRRSTGTGRGWGSLSGPSEEQRTSQIAQVASTAAIAQAAAEKAEAEMGRCGRCLRWLRHLRASVSREYVILNLQVLRMIFLDVHDLPNNFAFPHYASTSLNAITVGFINVQPSSYAVLVVVILLSELLVRHRPTVLWKASDDRLDVADDESLYEGTAIPVELTGKLFALLGIVLCALDVIVAITLRGAISVLVCERLGKATMAEAFEDLKAGEFRRQNHGRTMKELGHDLAAYIDPHFLDEVDMYHDAAHENSDALGGPNGEEGANVYDSIQFPASFRVQQPGGGAAVPARGLKHAGALNNSFKLHEAHLAQAAKGHKEGDGAGVQMRPQSSKLLKGAALAASFVSANSPRPPALLHQKGSGLSFRRKVKTPEQKEAERRRKKIATMLMHSKAAGHGGSHMTDDTLKEQMEKDKSWVNTDADILKGSVQGSLPFSSMTFIHRTIDAARLLKNFYIAIFVTTFLTETFSGEFSTGTDLALWVGFGLLVLANVLLDPFITYELGLLTTMACVNPLLLGETVEYMHDITHMLEQVSSKLVSRHHHQLLTARLRRSVPAAEGSDTGSPDAYLRMDSEAALEMTSETVAQFLVASFAEWAQGRRSVDRRRFAQVMHHDGLHFSNRQLARLFRYLDPDMSGSIDCEEFTGKLERSVLWEMHRMQEHINEEAMNRKMSEAVQEVHGVSGGKPSSATGGGGDELKARNVTFSTHEGLASQLSPELFPGEPLLDKAAEKLARSTAGQKKAASPAAREVYTVDELFAKIDRNHDNILTRSEMVSAAGLLRMTEEEAGDLFDELDVLGNGHLGRKEFNGASAALSGALSNLGGGLGAGLSAIGGFLESSSASVAQASVGRVTTKKNAFIDTPLGTAL